MFDMSFIFEFFLSDKVLCLNSLLNNSFFYFELWELFLMFYFPVLVFFLIYSQHAGANDEIWKLENKFRKWNMEHNTFLDFWSSILKLICVFLMWVSRCYCSVVFVVGPLAMRHVRSSSLSFVVLGPKYPVGGNTAMDTLIYRHPCTLSTSPLLCPPTSWTGCRKTRCTTKGWEAAGSTRHTMDARHV